MEDPAPKPLSNQEKEQIYRKLEARENAHLEWCRPEASDRLS